MPTGGDRRLALVGAVAVAVLGVFVVLDFPGPAGSSGLRPVALVVVLVGAGVAAALLARAAGGRPRAREVVLPAAVATAGALVGAVTGGSEEIAAPALVLTLVATLTATAGVLLAGRRPEAALLAAAGPALAAALVVRATARGGAYEEQQLALLQVVGGSVALLGLAVALAVGVLTALVGRHTRWSAAVLRREPPDLALAGGAAVVVVLLAARHASASGAPPGAGGRLDGSPVSWVHAALTAAVLVGVAVRTEGRPLPAGGRLRALLVAGLWGVAVLGLGLLLAVVLLVVSVVPGTDADQVFDLGEDVVAAVPVLLLTASAASLVVGAVVAWRRGVTVLAVVLVVLGLWNLPHATRLALTGADGVPPTTRGLAAVPEQVCLLVAVTVLAGVALGRRDLRRPLLRCLLVPVVLVLAVDLTAGWSTAVWRVVVVVGLLAAVVLDRPDVPATQPGARLVGRLGRTCGVLVVYYAALTAARLGGQDVRDGLGVATELVELLAVVPAAAVLVCRLTDDRGRTAPTRAPQEPQTPFRHPE